MAAVAVSVANGDTIILGDAARQDWRGQPVMTSLAEPDSNAWRKASCVEYARQMGFDRRRGLERIGEQDVGKFAGVWKEREVFVPADWKDGFVRFVQEGMNEEDLLLWVNGQKAGEILRPAGEIDVSPWIRAGETNVLRVYLTHSGLETSRGKTDIPKNWQPWCMGPLEPCRLEMTKGPAITDVFCNPSWREKRLRVEVEVERESKSKVAVEEWNCSVLVVDQDGKVVKSARSLVSRLKSLPSSDPRITRFAVDIPWADPIPWELGRPYLYTAKIRLSHHSSTSTLDFDSCFGFREIWREGRELYMNGHKLHIRPVYSFGANEWGVRMLRDVGYNVITCNHNMRAIGNSVSTNLWDWLDRNGMGIVLNPGAFPAVDGGTWHTHAAFATNTVSQQRYRDFIRAWHRKHRNHPSLFAAYVTQMIICDIGNFHPAVLAQQTTPRSGKHKAIEVAADINREYNPNILYYSHADGSCADLSSGNLYLNWTPLEERENWLSQWSEKGTWPWHSAEFGQPYGGSWYNCDGEAGFTKYSAIYFGDWAYESEPMFALTNSVAARTTNKSRHASPLGTAIAKTHPGYWALQRLWTRNTNRAWRGFGQGGGNLYFNLNVAYGDVPKASKWDHLPGYGRMTESNYLHRAEWTNPAYEIYQQGNKDFCGFIGGWPVHTDKTHAYYSGETIKKQYVLIWDGPGTTNVMGRTLTTGDIVKIPFEFKAPEVTAKTICTNRCDFDEFVYEVYPREGEGGVRSGGRVRGLEVALLDPTGEGAKILDGLDVRYKRIASCAEIRQSSNRTIEQLVIGPYALDTALLEIDPADVKAGLRVLIMNQRGETWEALGFKVMDTASRIFFTHREDLGFSNDALRYWRGAPKYGEKTFGALMPHQAARGPRWTYNHAVALFALQIPDEVGVEPLVEGEFDMGYSAAIRLRAGKGSVTYSSFEFKDRVPDDPAATLTARALVCAALGEVEGEGEQRRSDLLSLKREVAKLLPLPKDQPVYRIEQSNNLNNPNNRTILRGIGPNLLRWSVPITNEIPESCSRFWARVKTNAGWEPDDLTLTRMLTLVGSSESSPLPVAHVMGPYNLLGYKRLKDGCKPNEFLAAKFEPVESMAIAGDYNPNSDYDLPQGGKANWRPTLLPDEAGCFDFAKLFATNGSQMAYSICEVERKREGRAKMFLGFDWSGIVWVNGQEVFRTMSGARRAQFEIAVDLKAGKNVVTFKTLSRRSGDHAFWALLENESQGERKGVSREVEAKTLYHEPLWVSDPYTFYYW